MVVMTMEDVIIKAPDDGKIDVDKTATYVFLGKKLAYALEEDVSITIDYVMNDITLTKQSDNTKRIAIDISNNGAELIRQVTAVIIKYKDFMN